MVLEAQIQYWISFPSNNFVNYLVGSGASSGLLKKVRKPWYSSLSNLAFIATVHLANEERKNKNFKFYFNCLQNKISIVTIPIPEITITYKRSPKIYFFL